MPRMLQIALRLVTLIGVQAIAVVCTVRLAAGPAGALVDVAASPQAADAQTVDGLVADLAAAALLVAVLGAAAMSTLAVAAALAADRSPTLASACAAITPRRYRRLAAVLLGMGLAGPAAVAGPALAGQAGHAPACQLRCQPESTGLSGLRLPDLPVISPTRPQRAVQDQQIVVRAGDSLWRLAEQRLPGGSDAEIATLTWRLYALNRSTIGEDPDLIFPGMTLIAPEGSP